MGKESHKDLERGDLIWLNFTPQAGFELKGRHPAVVISPHWYNKRSNFVLIAGITSSPSNWTYAYELPEGLKTTGKVYVDQLKSYDLRARSWSYVETITDEAWLNGLLDRVGTLTQ